MRIVFFSNYLNHHQLPFCLAMDRLTGGEFTFVSTMPMPESRKAMGYQDMDRQYPFVLATYGAPGAQEEALALAETCDVMIIGSAPEIYLRRRMAAGKLTFRYSERLYKKSYLSFFSPYGRKWMRRNHSIYKDKPLYMLCASNYTAGDFGLSGVYRGKTYKWGYFPEVKKIDPHQLWEKKKEEEKPKLLWVGRLIGLKHPEAAVSVAAHLHRHGYDFEMNIIGSGEMETELCQMIEGQGLQSCVNLLGAMPPEQVRAYMEKSQIYLFTSDRGEGWGAVLNESMNAACAVVASHAAGSVDFLMRDGENGIIYKSGRQHRLNAAVRRLMDDEMLREKMGKNASQTMTETWNADAAAERLLSLCKALSDGGATPFEDGPCSIAKRVYL